MNGPAKLRVFMAGSGPTIVILPGQGRGPSSLEPLAQRLIAGGFRVVLPEWRGYGGSVGPMEGVTMRDISADVVRAIEVAGGAPVVLAGHAFGNRVGRMIAQDHPQLVRGVVIMAAGGRFPMSPETAKNFRAFQDKALSPDVRAAAARAAFFGPRSNPQADDIMLDGISIDTIKMQVAAGNPKLFPLETWWPGGKGPMLVIQGLADVIAPPENGRSLKADYPDRVTLVEFPDLGHLMLRERPDLTTDAIIAFVEKLAN
jgi:pimeloyl-ACP methyl ester carboxylesterase